MSSVVSSYEAQFRATGVAETKSGFAEIAKAAALADRQNKVAAQNLRDSARAQIQTDKELARSTQQRAQQQAPKAQVTP